MANVLLIDGYSILNRAFYGIPLLTNAEGLYTNGVYGFLNILFKVMDEEKADYLAVAFDVHEKTFRHKTYEAYKGTRKGMPPELLSQVPVLQEVLKSMEIPCIECPGFEADDILGTLSVVYEKLGHHVTLLSGDRDLLQLATEHVKISIPKTKMSGTQIEHYYAADVLEKYGVTPTEFIDLKALMGDASDNIPGVPGIGEKTASKIISTYHSIEEAHAHALELKPKKASENMIAFWDQALLSKFLAAIKTDVLLDFEPEDGRIGRILNPDSYKQFKRLEFSQLLKRFDTIPEDEVTYPKVRLLSDFFSVTAFLDGITKDDRLGIFYYKENEEEGVVLAGIGDEPVWIRAEGMISPEYLKGEILKVIHRAALTCTINVKALGHSIEDLTMEDRLFDASIAAYLLNPLKSVFTYDSMAQDHLNLTLPSRNDWIKKAAIGEVPAEDANKLENYLAQEALMPLKLYDVLMEKLDEAGMLSLYQDIELPLAFVLRDMERFGIQVESEALSQYGLDLTGRIQELEEGIYELAGETFNILSPKQLGVILFEKMNLPYGKKTKTGYSTSAEVLEKLKNVDPIVNLILEYRQLTKLKSTYADGLSAYIQPDRRIHGLFHQTITATGRLSSAEPNLQNIPVRMELGRMIRKVFVPMEGCRFVNADYSQIELRVLAHMAGDENLIEAYWQEEDIHRMTASKVFHTHLEEVTPAQRRDAKAVNFGIVYGISSFGLSQDLSISRKEAEHYIDSYFETYPGIKSYLDDAVSGARESGYSTTLFGRRRPIPELTSSNFMTRSFGERVAMNSPIQGTAADIIKIAMIRVSKRLKAEGLRSRLILQIHDELLIEADNSEVEIVKTILKEEMEHAAALKVPLDVDMHEGDNWYVLK